MLVLKIKRSVNASGRGLLTIRIQLHICNSTLPNRLAKMILFNFSRLSTNSRAPSISKLVRICPDQNGNVEGNLKSQFCRPKHHYS